MKRVHELNLFRAVSFPVFRLTRAM